MRRSLPPPQTAPQMRATAAASRRLPAAILAAVFLALGASGAVAYRFWPPSEAPVRAAIDPPRIWAGEPGSAAPVFARADHAEAAPLAAGRPRGLDAPRRAITEADRTPVPATAGITVPPGPAASEPREPARPDPAKPAPTAEPLRITDAAPAARPPRRPELAEPAAEVHAAAARAVGRSPRPAARPVAPAEAVRAARAPAGAEAQACAAAHAASLPRRPAGAPGGQAVLARLSDLTGRRRDAAVAEAILAGNFPEFQRRLVPVTLVGTTSGGARTRITLCVLPDYLALGHDGDFVRVPLGLPAASRIAERFGMLLPTARMVDAIHAQARVRLTPRPMTPGPQMESTAYLLRHNATLEAQRARAGAGPGALIAGHKKDLVLTNRLAERPGRVAIYGWHHPDGRPIQPLSTVHGAGYADYSHGVRLVGGTAFIDGRAADLRALLADPRHAAILSDEGPIAPSVRLAALR